MPTRFPAFYNLTQPVGNAKPNLQLDVMLVQFFLNEVVNQRSSSANSLVVNGVLDGAATAAITSFQNSVSWLYADGIVDPVPERNLTAQTPIHSKEYTIFELNHQFELKQPQTFNRLWEHPRCPAALGSALSMTFRAIHG